MAAIYWHTFAYHGAVLSVVAGLLAVAIGLQSALPRSWGGGNTMVSPTVWASWLTERAGNGPEQLQLLILWRGAPGWYLAPGGVRSGRSEDSSGVARHLSIQFGDIHLTLDQRAGNAVTVNGREVPVGTDNVVYVDNVDALAGARVVRTSRIPSKMPGSAGQIGLAIRDAPDILAYLQCEARATDPQRQRMIEGAAACVVTLGR